MSVRDTFIVFKDNGNVFLQVFPKDNHWVDMKTLKFLEPYGQWLGPGTGEGEDVFLFHQEDTSLEAAYNLVKLRGLEYDNTKHIRELFLDDPSLELYIPEPTNQGE